jgi:hypothetical protein
MKEGRIPRICGRCLQPLLPGEPWDAGHIEAAALGGGPEVRPEHVRCNRGDGARLKAQIAKQRAKEEADRRAAAQIAETYKLLEGVR